MEVIIDFSEKAVLLTKTEEKLDRMVSCLDEGYMIDEAKLMKRVLCSVHEEHQVSST